MRQDKTQEQLSDLLKEARNYLGHQQEYIRLTLAEQMTVLLGRIAIAMISIILALTILVFLGLALVHWIGEAIGNIGLCYAVFALFMVLILALFHANRRKWIILPLARMMSQAFLGSENDNQSEERNDEQAE